MMKEYGDEPFIRFVREKQVMGRNWDIRKGSVWPDGEEMLFAEREVIKKRLWLWMPDSFSKLSEELALVKYPDQNCPDLIYTDPTTTVIVSFTKMQMEAGRETEACDSMERQIRDAYGEESVQGTEIVYAGEMEIPCLISVTPALDAAVYNRMFFFSLEHNVYLGVCNCLEQSDWKELLRNGGVYTCCVTVRSGSSINEKIGDGAMADQKQKKDAEGEKSPKENQKADRKQKNKQEKKQDKKQEKQTKMPEPGVIGVVTGSMLSGLGSGKAVVGGKGVSSNQNIKNAYDKNRNRLKCFVGDTLVLTKEGYYPIKEVHTGVLVYSRNVQTGEDGWQEVEHMSVSGTHTIYEICLDGEETLKTTAYHPVFIKGQGWVNAIQLQAGDLVETLEDAAKITDVKKVRYEEPVDVYNLQVAKWASFFVSKRQALVHNCAMDQGLSKDAATGYEKIIDFREQNGINAYDKSKKNTVAHIQVEGKNYFGANSNLLVPQLKEKVLERNRRLFGEIKWVPPKAKPPKHPGHTQSLTHAEASALLQVSENVKPMPKKITMTVDRVTCSWCRRELPVIMRHLGVEELEIYSGDLDEPAADSKKREPLLLKAADPVPE